MTISISSAFKTPDGKTFDTRKAAEAHQSKLTRVAKLHAFIETTDGLVDSVLANDDVLDLIAGYADEITAALNNPLGKGRKSKTPAV